MPISLLVALQLWTTTPRKPPVILEGNWQSCPEGVSYAERVYEYRLNGVHKWELHMGPHDEFALFTTQVNDEDGSEHASVANLLGPAYHISDINTLRHDRTWKLPKLHLWINIVRAGGSRDDCESFYIRIEDISNTNRSRRR